MTTRDRLRRRALLDEPGPGSAELLAEPLDLALQLGDAGVLLLLRAGAPLGVDGALATEPAEFALLPRPERPR